MSWKKSGGIKQFESFTNLNVNAISTDDFTMRNAYNGTFSINGYLFVTNDCSLNGIVEIGESVMVGKNAYVQDSIYIGDRHKTKMKTSSLGLGMNVENPLAMLDISGSNSLIMNVYSSQANVSSTLLRNVCNDTAGLVLDCCGASLYFAISGETISMTYDLSKDLLLFNRDVSFIGTAFIGEDAAIIGNVNIHKNARIGGNLMISSEVDIGGNLMVSGEHSSMEHNLTVGGNLEVNGSATLDNVTIRNGVNIDNNLSLNGNIIFNGNTGLYFEKLNSTAPIIFPSNDNSALSINSNVIIRENLIIYGSTSFEGSLDTIFGENSRLYDISGSKLTQFHTNYRSPNTALKGAGFYIYNRVLTSDSNGNYMGEDQDQINDGFMKISDICDNKLSFRSVGDRNTVAMDLPKMKNPHKSGLLVLKYVTNELNNTNDNYNIISSHTDVSAIDVSNTLMGVVDIIVGNAIFCEKNIFAATGIFEDVSSTNISISDTYRGNSIILNFGSSDSDYSGNRDMVQTFLDLKSKTSGIVSISALNVFTGTNTFRLDTFFDGNLYGNNIFCRGNAYLQDTVIDGNISITSGAFLNNVSMRANLTVLDRIVSKDISCNGNIYINEASIRKINNLCTFGDSVVMSGNLSVVNKLSGSDVSAVNVLIGNSLSVVKNASISGNIFVQGTSSFVGDVSCSTNLQVRGNVNVRGSLNLIDSQNTTYTVTPTKLSYLNNVNRDIQDQINGINAISLLADNTFKGQNTFEGNIIGTNFDIINSVSVLGQPSTDRSIYYEFGGTSVNDGKYVYCKRNNKGTFSTKDSIKCLGETVTRYFVDTQATVIKTAFNGDMTADEFFSRGLQSSTDGSISRDSRLEGGMVEALDISFNRNFYMNGKVYLTGGSFVVGTKEYSAAVFDKVMSTGVSGGTSTTAFSGQDFSGESVFLGNVIINSDNGSNFFWGAEEIRLSNLTRLTRDVQTTLDNLMTNRNSSADGYSTISITGNTYLNNLECNGDVLLSGNLTTLNNLECAGNIVVLGDGYVSASSFNTSSDYRLKTDVQTMSGSFYTVDHLRPVTYTMKNSGHSRIGFIAHELQEHVPSAVLGLKDAPTMQSVNYAEIIPILVKEIQEMKREIVALKKRIV